LGGVFDEATDRGVDASTESVGFDRRFYPHDIDASIAHAQMLANVGLISQDECQQIEQALQEIRQEIQQGRFQFSSHLEDIPLRIERALIEWDAYLACADASCDSTPTGPATRLELRRLAREANETIGAVSRRGHPGL
jgi:hypothetical protein